MNLGRIHLLWSHHSVSSPLLQPGPGTRHFDMLTMKKGANILLLSVMQIKLTALTNLISFQSKLISLKAFGSIFCFLTLANSLYFDLCSPKLQLSFRQTPPKSKRQTSPSSKFRFCLSVSLYFKWKLWEQSWLLS